jgi:hypothetical protein
MNRVAVALATLLVAAAGSVAANDARAEVAGPVITQRQPAKPLATEIKQARVETSGAKTFIINGRRVLVPSDGNAEAVIKALKARYPSLQADAGAQRTATVK